MTFIIRTLLAALWIAGTTVAISPAASAAVLHMTSPAFADGETMPNSTAFNGFGCSGKNESPALSWTGVPSGTKSFALTVFDPDAQTGHGWVHWVAFNIPGTATGLPANAGAAGNTGAITLGLSDFGTSAYGGPCPPRRDVPHHYAFVLYALDIPKLELDSTTTLAKLSITLRGHVRGQAKLIGRYGR
jgi:Raf kinase inhibitor-like YbhB/YbcL family protein